MFMKLATCSLSEKKFIAAVIPEREYVLDLFAFSQEINEENINSRFFCDMLSFLRGGDDAMRDAIFLLTKAAGNQFLFEDSNSFCNIKDVKFEAPIQYPGKLFCLAGNYKEHIEEMYEKIAVQDMETPRVFMKPSSNTVIGSGDEILIPPVGQAIDWEGELAVVIGKTAKYANAENALDYVAGYTIMNDVSERKLKIKERTSNRPKDEWFDWLNGKWLDTFAPMGPWIVTADEIVNPHDLEITTHVNGECRQQNNTSQMLMKIPQIIEYISAIITLSPGDVISTGTIAGVGAATEVYLKDGDNVMIAISNIGELRNRVREE